MALCGTRAGCVIDAGPLSRREREVARLVAAGMTNREIGERLFISWRTVEGHIERIRSKLGVRWQKTNNPLPHWSYSCVM